MNRPARRFALAIPGLVLVLVVAACSASSSVAPPSSEPTDEAPSPTHSPSTPATPAPSASPNQGNVNGGYPELSVELRDGYVVAVTDPAAKAWRVAIRGARLNAEDRFEIVVEVGDVAPAAEARIYVRGALVDVIDMTGMVGVDTAAAGGCHPTLRLCVGSDTLTIDPERGRLTVLVEALDDAGDVEIQGATADWPGEPFILGPWRTTDPFATF